MTPSHDELAAIQGQLETVLEQRLTSLLGQIKACQEVTAQIAATTLDIQQQEALREQLEEQLTRLSSESRDLQRSNEARQARLTKLEEKVQKMRNLRAELISSLADLTGE